MVLLKKTLLLALATLFLSQCASTSTKEGFSNQGRVPLSIFFGTHRRLELEPCGCSLAPRGGIVREFNYLTAARKGVANSFYFLTGTTFTPEDSKLEGSHKIKANSLAQAFSRIGVNAIGFDASDAVLGENRLRELATMGGFQWISSNTVDAKTGKSLFAPFAMFNVGEARLAVLAITPNAKTKSKNIRVEDPEKALDQVLASLPKGPGQAPSMILVLTSFPEDTRNKLADKFPQVNLFLGLNKDLTNSGVNQHNKNTVFVEGETRGRAITRLDLAVAPKTEHVYNKGLSDAIVSTRDWWKSVIARDENNLLRTVSSEDKDYLRQSIASRKAFLARTEGFPIEPSENTTYIKYENTLLTGEFENPPNGLNAVINEMKAQVHKAALD